MKARKGCHAVVPDVMADAALEPRRLLRVTQFDAL